MMPSSVRARGRNELAHSMTINRKTDLDLRLDRIMVRSCPSDGSILLAAGNVVAVKVSTGLQIGNFLHERVGADWGHHTYRGPLN